MNRKVDFLKKDVSQAKDNNTRIIAIITLLSIYLPILLHPHIDGQPAFSGPWAGDLSSGQQPNQESWQLRRYTPVSEIMA